jgi:hypothetical protein
LCPAKIAPGKKGVLFTQAKVVRKQLKPFAVFHREALAKFEWQQAAKLMKKTADGNLPK